MKTQTGWFAIVCLGTALFVQQSAGAMTFKSIGGAVYNGNVAIVDSNVVTIQATTTKSGVKAVTIQDVSRGLRCERWGLGGLRFTGGGAQ